MAASFAPLHRPRALTLTCEDCHALTVYVSGELDAASAPGLVDQLPDDVARWASVVIDLSGVSFLDSSGAKALIDVDRRCGGRLFVRSAPPAVARVLEILGLDHLTRPRAA